MSVLFKGTIVTLLFSVSIILEDTIVHPVLQDILMFMAMALIVLVSVLTSFDSFSFIKDFKKFELFYNSFVIDIDECEIGLDNCSLYGLNCTNLPGRFNCTTCSKGFIETSSGCTSTFQK